MPLIHRSSYQAPFYLKNGHLLTVYPTIARSCSPALYVRERIDTPDGDFLDLDWSRVNSRKLVILSHGLEGSTHRHYMIGMASAMNAQGWDALAWNYRGCSGETNRTLRMYHNGCTDDLDAVVQHALRSGQYDAVSFIGFSLGGNLTLMYLGSSGTNLDIRIRGAATFSVPCDLKAGALELAKNRNCIYMKQFLASLHVKIKRKMEQWPGSLSDEGYWRIRDFQAFDDRYTAPLHGFRDAEDYWEKCSSARFLAGIRVPALIVNALDDPFLAGACYPREQATSSSTVFLEMPEHGGHVGFVPRNSAVRYWSEVRAAAFLQKVFRSSDVPA